MSVLEKIGSWFRRVPAEEDKPSYPLMRFAELDDAKRIVHLERVSGQEDVWDMKNVLELLGAKRCHVILFEEQDNDGDVWTTGYLAYRTEKLFNVLLSVVVHPKRRRKRIGSTLVEVFKDVPNDTKRPYALTLCRARNVEFQQFLKFNDFSCTDILPEYFETPEDDAYQFEWQEF